MWLWKLNHSTISLPRRLHGTSHVVVVTVWTAINEANRHHNFSFPSNINGQLSVTQHFQFLYGSPGLFDSGKGWSTVKSGPTVHRGLLLSNDLHMEYIVVSHDEFGRLYFKPGKHLLYVVWNRVGLASVKMRIASNSGSVVCLLTKVKWDEQPHLI